MTSRLDRYLKSLGPVGLNELLKSMQVVQEKIVGEYYPRAMKERETAQPNEKCKCCDRGDEYNGYGSEGPRLFTCPKGCACHD